MSTSSSTSSVRVAVRVRPLTAQEIQQNCHNRITFTPNLPQITVGGDRSFTFDYAYPPSADQEQVYSTCVVPLLQKYLDGYNSTILAYGQTGSGKTYSMGIGLESATEQQDGIVPRFIHSLFDQLTAKSNAVSGYSYQVLVTFLELYNEDLVDLLRQPRIDGLNVSIREDSQGNICWIGVREEPVNNAHELLELLNRGSIARTTASTDMNRVSSRSHAIFSVILKQTIPDDNVEKRLVSKFHFVDLAGSERLKRTNAVGDRAREGISINTGLLALGNVISALGDESRKVSHVPYRDSKLTRLLQDSLGGNSQTLMLACVSPADSNYTETLNTLKYANRARNIRNRATVNQEVGGESDRLKAHVLKLKEELKSNEEFLRAVNQEMDSLKSEVEVLTATMTKMTQELALTKCERDMLKSQHGSSVSLDGLMAEYAQTIERLRTEIKLQTGRQQQTIITTTSPPSPPLPPSPPRSSHTLTSSSHAAATEQQQQQQQQQHPVEKSPKKKRHSYRFGSKRGRRRVSINFNSSPKSKLKPSSRPNTSDDAYQMIQKAKSELLDEMAFLKAAQRWSFHAGSPWHRASTPPTPDDSDIMEFANSFPDQSLTLASSHEQRHQQLQHQLPASTYNLLVKFQQCVKSKSELIQLLERSEAQRSEMQELHANAISELTNKKNAALVQHRRDMNDMRSQYESRLKKLTCELNALKRKHAQAIRSAETARSKSNAIILGLKQKLDKANSEKKKMIKKLKQESDRAREKCSHLDKEMAKLKRQESQAVQARKRMERDVVQHKATAKRATEEMMELSGQMKQVALMLKKIMATEKMDKSVLAKAMACASVRGYLIRQSLQRGSIRRRKIIPKNMNDATKLAPPLYHKKRLLHRAIAMHVRATRTEVADLKQKRDRLQREQQELLAERQRVLQDEAQRLGNNVERTSSSVDGSVPQYMDDRIDTITVQLDFYNDQLARLEQKGEDQWTDVQEAVDGVQELEQFIKDDDPQVAYQVALALIRSLEPEEARPVAEALMDEIIELKQKQISPTLVQGMDATIQRLQRTLVQMRRQAAATGWISSEQDGINTVFDCLFTRAMQQPVQILHGLALPGKRIANSVSTPTSNTRTHHQFRTRKRSLLPHRSPPPLPPPRAESSPAIVRL